MGGLKCYFNRVDIEIDGKTIAQKDRAFFEQSDPNKFFVFKDTDGKYKVKLSSITYHVHNKTNKTIEVEFWKRVNYKSISISSLWLKPNEEKYMDLAEFSHVDIHIGPITIRQIDKVVFDKSDSRKILVIEESPGSYGVMPAN